MQLAFLAVRAFAVVIVNAVCNVRGLLYFRHYQPRADGVYASGRDKETISCRHFIGAQPVNDFPALYQFGIFRFVGFFRKAAHQTRAFVRLEHIPHFRFAETVVPRTGQLVIGVHLNGQIFGRVNKFKQQGKIVARSGADFFTQQFRPEMFAQKVQILAGQRTVFSHGHIAFYGGQLPGFPRIFRRQGLVQVITQLIAAPNGLFENRAEFQRIQIHLLSRFFLSISFSANEYAPIATARLVPSLERAMPTFLSLL